MRTIRIRTFTILSLVLMLLLPWLFFVTAHIIETKTLRFDMSERQKQDLANTRSFIEKNSEHWTDPVWQKQLRGRLQVTNMGVEILSESNQQIFTYIPKHGSSISTEQFSIIHGENVLGRVVIYPQNSRLVPMLATFAGLFVALFMIGYEMRGFILKPLEKLSSGVRKIAEGDLEVSLPVSRITEITEVSDGFKVMVDGLRESMKKQVKLEEERRFVIAAVAHDLRTPLFALRGYLDGLEQGIADSPEKQEKYLQVCKEKSAQLDRLVEDLFTFTKTEFLEMELKENTVDLSFVLQKSIDSVHPLAHQKHISIIVNQFDKDCMVIGDAHLLERAMNNLLDNAVRHTPRHGEIFVECYKNGNNVSFTFTDTGEGFSSEELQHVFEPLYRGESSRNRSTGGVGLGLTISKRIITQHGGDLVAGNYSDGGALLRGWIPLANSSLCSHT
ncbi:HAMP domain-containing histidine kinase [Lederbergia sp. NSJ-179]|uniref:sensor histidine kinase n=1 Tax=Lederbergia sp. NSJ-179 TaxID=2931402 RepID=UPI001FD4FB87|nr:HAMP domain-containing sensor histidine kinase [Lederbergia sp. NSJ-179]MCJ7841620.1 HAMP domain-containing histidine kinase [Lederbergia sp. NSJ-179]